VRLVFAGTPATAVPSLDLLLRSDRHEVAAVVTRPDRPAGRGRTLTPSPVRLRAEESGIEVLTPERASDPDFLDRLRAIAPDCCPVVAYGALLKPEALAVPAHGWVNLHFSLLPAWRGAAPVQHALLAGDDITGASTFLIEEGLDTGPVFGMVTATIGPRDTTGELLGRLAIDGAGLLQATVDGIADGAITPQPQTDDGVSYAPKLTVGDARVDWTAPALRVDRLVRACTPDPGPWTTFRDRRIKLGPVLPLAPDAATPVVDRPGAVTLVGVDVLVATGSTWVRLGEVRPEGKAMMAAADWARGVRLQSTDAFE
jgi:methionyl-tRNA formyltransferase